MKMKRSHLDPLSPDLGENKSAVVVKLRVDVAVLRVDGEGLRVEVLGGFVVSSLESLVALLFQRR